VAETAAQAAARANQLTARIGALQADQAVWARQAADAKAASEFLDACAEAAEQVAADAQSIAANCELRATGQSEFVTFCAPDSSVPSRVLADTAGSMRTVVGVVSRGWQGETAEAYTDAAKRALDSVQIGTRKVEVWYRQNAQNAALIAERARERANTWRGEAVVQRRIVAARNDSIAAANREIRTLDTQLDAARAAQQAALTAEANT